MELLKTVFIYFLYFAGLIVFYRGFRYITTPAAKRIGFYKYYSRIFFILPLGNNLREMHIGTTWDFFRLKRVNQLKLLYFMSEGLINLASAIEKGEISMNMRFIATVYYFKASTLGKFGFKVRKLNLKEKLMFMLNYPELCLIYSISTKKLQLIPLKNINMIDCRGFELVMNKQKFIEHFRKLKLKMTNDADMEYILAA